MNMLLKSAEVQCRGPLTKYGVRQLPIRAFMDDLTLTTTSVPGSRWILKEIFKPAISRALVLNKGKTTTRNQ